MFNYTGVKCPYCDLEITEGQDVAVCPECGTPHHRSCYVEHGHCANEILHSPSFEWKRPDEPANTVQSSSGAAVRCAQCGAQNAPGNAFCDNCGAALSSSLSPGDRYAEPDLDTDSSGYGSPFSQAGPYSIDELYTKDSKIDDIPVSEWITYIGNSAPYYLYNFKAQDRMKKKTAFTWSAAFFPGIYFLYRRVWGAGIIAIIASFLLAVSSTVELVLLPAGITLFGLSADFWQTATMVSQIATVAISLFWGVFAVWFFRKKAARQMHKLKLTSVTQDEYLYRLNKKSGPNRPILVAIAAYYFLMAFLSWRLL